MFFQHSVTGLPREGWNAFFFDGRLCAVEESLGCRNQQNFVECPGLVGTPVWVNNAIEYTCIDNANVSYFHRWDPGGGVTKRKLPAGVISAYSFSGGLAVALASPGSGHLTQLATLTPDEVCIDKFAVRGTWRVAVEPRTSEVIWTLSRRGRRFTVHQRLNEFSRLKHDWPSADWQQVWFRPPHIRFSIPAWFRGNPNAPCVWVVLHGGPGLAWDVGLPAWLAKSVNADDGLLLLESPGSVGFGGDLLHWRWNANASKDFAQVLESVFDWVRKNCPQSRLVLCGESDGAMYALDAAGYAGYSLDLLALINGEYPKPPENILSLKIANILVVTSDHDDIVDNATAVKLLEMLHFSECAFQHLRIPEGHRWNSHESSEKVASSIRTILAKRYEISQSANPAS